VSAAPAGTLPTREQALALLHEWVENANLRKHALAVEMAMRAYAVRWGEDEARWALTGLIHDFDWERHPDLERHPALGVAHLRTLGWPEDVLEAVMGHAPHTGTARTSRMAKTLFACDELCGLLTACALVQPDRKLASVEVASVRKKMKSAGFARNVNREDIVQGAAELGEDLDAHIAFVLAAMQAGAAELGL